MKSWLDCVLITLGVFTLYFSSLTAEYAYNDDYQYLNRSQIGQFEVFANDLVGQGRFLSGPITAAGFGLCEDIQSLWKLRLISLIGVCLFSIALFKMLRTAGMARTHSHIATALVFSSPATVVWVGWASCFTYSWGALAVLGAVYLAFSACDYGEKKRWAFVFLAWLGSFLANLAALAIYQPLLSLSLGLPWLLVVIPWLTRYKLEKLWFKLGAALASGLGAAALYRITLYPLASFLGLKADQLKNRAVLNTNPLEVAELIWSQYLWPASGSWGLFWGGFGGHLAMALLCFSGILALVVMGCLKKQVGFGFLLLGAVGGATVLNGMLGTANTASRTAIGLFVVLAVLSVLGWNIVLNWFRTRSRALACAGLFAAALLQIVSARIYFELGIVQPAQIEIAAIRQKLDQHEEPVSKSILYQFPQLHPFGSDFDYRLRFPLFREFGQYSSPLPWNTHHFITLLLEERYGDIYPQGPSGWIGISFPPHVYGIEGKQRGLWDLSPSSSLPGAQGVETIHPAFGPCILYGNKSLISKNWGSINLQAYPWIYHSLWGWLKVETVEDNGRVTFWDFELTTIYSQSAELPLFRQKNTDQVYRFNALYLPGRNAQKIDKANNQAP